MHLEHVAQINSCNFEIQKPSLPVKPQHDKSTGKGNKYPGEMDCRSYDGLKMKVQKQENNDQTYWDHNRKALYSSDLVFIAPGKFIAYPCRYS